MDQIALNTLDELGFWLLWIVVCFLAVAAGLAATILLAWTMGFEIDWSWRPWPKSR